MAWELKSDRPIYLQISEEIELRIITGLYPPGGKMPSVRDLASEAAVNPNTMQRALSELERNGLLYAERTAGRFVTEDRELIQSVKDSFAQEVIDAFFVKMEQLGYLHNEAMQLLSKQSGGTKHE